jgi:hypothetical protein
VPDLEVPSTFRVDRALCLMTPVDRTLDEVQIQISLLVEIPYILKLLTGPILKINFHGRNEIRAI